jgi:hypothetical protein
MAEYLAKTNEISNLVLRICHRTMKALKRNLSIAEIFQLGESGELLTQSQIGAVMQLSNSTVSRMVNSNQIPYAHSRWTTKEGCSVQMARN